MDKLYINNQPIDLGEEVEVYLTFRSNIMGDADGIMGNNSATIKVPHTEQNARTLEYAHLVTSRSTFPYRIHKAELYRNGLPLVNKATIYLLSANATDFELCLCWGASDGLLQMAEGGDELPTLAEQWDLRQWWQNVEDLNDQPTRRFPEAVYGFYRSIYNTKYWYHPVVTFQELWNAIKQRYSLNASISPATEERIADLGVVVAKSETPTEEWYGRFQPLTTESGVVELDKAVQTATSYMNGGKASKDDVSITSADIRIVATVRASFTLPYYAQVLLQDCARLNVGIRKEGEDDITPFLELFPTSVVPTATAFEWEVTFAYKEEDNLETLNKGDEIVFQFNYMPVPAQSANEYLFYYKGISSDSEATFMLKRGSINKGEEYYITRNLPKVEIIDFFKGLLNMLGLFIYTQGEQIIIRSYTELFQRKTVAQDWSSRLIMSESGIGDEQDFSLDGYYQVNHLTYENDDVNKQMNGSFRIENATLEHEGNLIELPFESYGIVENVLKPGLARLPFYKMTKGEGNTWNPSTEEGDISSDKMYVGRITPSNYLSREGLDWPSLLNNYYADIVSSIRQARYITAKFYFDTLALQKIDLGTPVYLRQYAAYFAIIEIKTKKLNIAEVKLLKIV